MRFELLLWAILAALSFFTYDALIPASPLPQEAYMTANEQQLANVLTLLFFGAFAVGCFRGGMYYQVTRYAKTKTEILEKGT